jgi:periplasmic protein TonB
VFRIDARIGKARSEPRLLVGPDDLAPPRLSLPTAPEVDGADPGGTDPVVRLRRPLPGAPPPADGERPVASEERPWRLSPIASLILHLLPLLLLLEWPTHPPAAVTPIPMRLVFQPPPAPPPPKPLPKPKLKPETRPPPGRIASVETGDTRTKGQDRAKIDEPTATKEPAATTESPLEAPERTAFLPPPPALPNPPKLELPNPPEPKPVTAPKPPAKPSLAARRLPLRRVPQQAHLFPRAARYPGPAASRDEYLAYLAYLAQRHIGLLTPSLIRDRRGVTIINVLVLDDGTVAMLSVGVSSGYPDIDERVEAMIRAVGRFPPLPQWYQAPAMRLEFRLQFPEALAD